MRTKQAKPGTIITLVMIAIICVSAIGIGSVLMRNNIARHNVLEECPQTELVIIGRNGAPQYVYDCTGINLKAKKD